MATARVILNREKQIFELSVGKDVILKRFSIPKGTNYLFNLSVDENDLLIQIVIENKEQLEYWNIAYNRIDCSTEWLNKDLKKINGRLVESFSNHELVKFISKNDTNEYFEYEVNFDQKKFFENRLGRIAESILVNEEGFIKDDNENIETEEPLGLILKKENKNQFDELKKSSKYFKKPSFEYKLIFRENNWTYVRDKNSGVPLIEQDNWGNMNVRYQINRWQIGYFSNGRFEYYPKELSVFIKSPSSGDSRSKEADEVLNFKIKEFVPFLTFDEFEDTIKSYIIESSKKINGKSYNRLRKKSSKYKKLLKLEYNNYINGCKTQSLAPKLSSWRGVAPLFLRERILAAAVRLALDLKSAVETMEDARRAEKEAEKKEKTEKERIRKQAEKEDFSDKRTYNDREKEEGSRTA